VKTFWILLVSTLGFGCNRQPVNRGGVSAMQGLTRGDTVEVLYKYDNPDRRPLSGIAVVFGIDTRDPSLVFVEYQDGNRVALHESYLFRARVK